MISFEPNIIVIDDKYNEVSGIVEHYQSNGSGCKFFNADIFEGDNMPDKTYSDVNLIFLDLYLEGENFDAEQCSNWVKSIIPEKAFYVLIIWSKDPSEADEVVTNLIKVNRSPFVILCENKVEYPPIDDKKYNFEELFKKLNDIFITTPALDEISIWKRNIKSSSNQVIGNLTKISDPNIFNNKLKKIIISHGGSAIKTNINNNRKRSILFDALDNVLISNSNKHNDEYEISELNNKELYSLENPQQLDIDKELNSWFHFKFNKENLDGQVLPGLIAYNNHSLFKQLYSIQDDPKLEKILTKQKEENIVIEDIVLVLSRPCDIAQNKFGKNIKLLSGIILKKAFRNAKGRIHFNETLPDSIKLYEHLFFNEDDNDITLMFDFRYSFSVPEKIFNTKFKNLKIFNKELLSEMQVEYSGYSSRLGITQVI
ncbi:hypothetical protein [Flavobacterium tructae]|uniref:hypothetical protein n=1 Tax=Flavobacterium tructae TaxID=1114873 RepID=UPI0035A8C29E